jgi:hypothetical protein
VVIVMSDVCVRCGHNRLDSPAAKPRVLDLCCDVGHDQVVKACEPCAWAMVRAQSLPCPLCAAEGVTSQAAVAVLCGFCRKGQHADCRSLRAGVRVMNDLPPRDSEGYCACTCDLDDPMVPGAGYARHPSQVKLDAFEADLREAFDARPELLGGGGAG